MHQVLKPLIAILLIGTVVAVVVGIVIASTHQDKVPYQAGGSQGTAQGDRKEPIPKHGGSSLSPLGGVINRTPDASEAARAADSPQGEISTDGTSQSRGNPVRSQKEAENSEEDNNSTEGFDCVPEARASLSEDKGRHCTPPYLCIAEKPDSGVGRCTHPDSLPTLHKSCDPAKPDGCDVGLRCSKSTLSCEPMRLLGERCDPRDKEMCLSGICRRKRPRTFSNIQNSTTHTAEEPGAKGAITEDAAVGDGYDYVCQRDVTCGQPCDSIFRICTGRCDVCGEDGLCTSNSSMRSPAEGPLDAALLQPKEEADNAPTRDQDEWVGVSGPEDNSDEEDDDQEEDDDEEDDVEEEDEEENDEEEVDGVTEDEDELSQSTGEDENKKKIQERCDVDIQLRENEVKGEAGKSCRQSGSPGKGESTGSQYEKEVTDSEDKREDAVVEREDSAEFDSSKTTTLTWATAPNQEYSASTASEEQGKSRFRAVQEAPLSSTHKQYPPLTLLPRMDWQTMKKLARKPAQKVDDGRVVGQFQDKARVQPVQQPQLPRSSRGSATGERAEAANHVDSTQASPIPITQQAESQKPQPFYDHVRRELTMYPSAARGQREARHQWWKEEDRLRQQGTHVGIIRYHQEAPQQAQQGHVGIIRYHQEAPQQAQQGNLHRPSFKLPPEEWRQQQGASLPMMQSRGGQLQQLDTRKTVGQWQRGVELPQHWRITQQHQRHQFKEQPTQQREVGLQTRSSRPLQMYKPQQRMEEERENQQQEDAKLLHQHLWHLRQPLLEVGDSQSPLQAAKTLRRPEKMQRHLRGPQLQHNEGLLPRDDSAVMIPTARREQSRVEQTPLPLRTQPQSSTGTALQTSPEQDVGGNQSTSPPIPQMRGDLLNESAAAEIWPPSSLLAGVNALFQAGKQTVQKYLDLLQAIPHSGESRKAVYEISPAVDRFSVPA